MLMMQKLFDQKELPECGTNDEVLAYHRLDVASLAESFRAAAARRRPASQLA